MNKLSYSIIVPIEKLFKNQAKLTFQFILEKELIGFHVNELYSSDLWILIKNKKRVFLWCRLTVEAIEEIYEGASNLGYIITGNVLDSEYFCRLDNDRTAFAINELYLSNFGTEYSVSINDPSRQNILNGLNDKLNVKLIPPQDFYTNILKPPMVGEDISAWLDNSICTLKKRFVRDELYVYKKYPIGWTPYECFVYSAIEDKAPIYKEEISLAIKNNRSKLGSQFGVIGERFIDLDFREIIPELISIRRFISPNDDRFISIRSLLEKTDKAEKIHQEMLRDITCYLKSLSISVFESLSVDMMIFGSAYDVIIELKSANEENYYNQIKNGAIQLKEYCYELSLQHKIKTIPILIVSRLTDEKGSNRGEGFLKYMNITLLFYDISKKWPERVADLAATVLKSKPTNPPWA